MAENATPPVVKGLVVLTLVGCLGAITRPDARSQASNFSGKLADGSQQVNSINQAQQKHFAEKQNFSKSIAALKLGIKTQSANYSYTTRATDKAAYSYGVSSRPSLRSYVGAVFVVFAAIAPQRQQEKTTVAIVCRTASPGNRIAEPVLRNGVPTCAPGTSPATR